MLNKLSEIVRRGKLEELTLTGSDLECQYQYSHLCELRFLKTENIKNPHYKKLFRIAKEEEAEFRRLEEQDKEFNAES